jgi:hypothetical protein
MKILQLIYESFNSPFGFGGAGGRAYEIYKRLTERHDITPKFQISLASNY